MLLLYRFFIGFLRVRFYGDTFERILDITAVNRITLWNSRLVKGGIESNITLKNFFKLREILRGKGIRVHILKKSGLPFLINKNRNRAGLVVGLAIFFVFLELMSGYIWIIDVDGNDSIPDGEILTLCESVGIHSGVKVNSINPKNRREKLMLKARGLAWVSLNIEGSRLTVNVSEAKNEEKKDAPCNLVASADGIIKKIDVSKGNCVVKVGDTVKKGDVLVSGVVEKADSTEFVASQGTVLASTKTSVSFSGKYKRTAKVENGEVIKKRLLEAFGIKIPLYLGCEAREYNSDLQKKELKLFGSRLPIAIYTREFKILEDYSITLERKELCDELRAQIAENVTAEEFSVESINFEETAYGVRLTALVTAEENIAIEKPLNIDKIE